MRTKVTTAFSRDEMLGRAIEQAIDVANTFLAKHPTGQIIQAQTLNEIDTSGDYPRRYYTYIITISYREEG